MVDSISKKVRIVTAGSLFDGHDAAINIMRRIMQSKGAEIIHLGHNRSVHEIVECAIEEDAHAIAITSYQGGHVEYFKYMKDLLTEAQCTHIKIFGGGGGTILPHEIEELHAYGIDKIYSPDDGRTLGLEGMIEDLLKQSVPENKEAPFYKAAENWSTLPPLQEQKDIRKIARAITLAELGMPYQKENTSYNPTVLGITGTGGAGKSSVTDEIVRRFLHGYTDKTIAVISVDPSKKKTGGALLGDRIRMNAVSHPRAYMRSMATREDNAALSHYIQDAIDICKSYHFDLIILESAGVGQSDTSILSFCDVSMYVMTPEYGAASQLEKINMLDYADIVCINKFDKAGALDAYNDVCKQYKRNHLLWTTANEDLPIIGTMASKFNDAGCNKLFNIIIHKIKEKTGTDFGNMQTGVIDENYQINDVIIPPKRNRYLSEISEAIHQYNHWVETQSTMATELYQLEGAINILNKK